MRNFITWFRSLGGRIPDRFEPVLVCDRVPVSSFKGRAEYIKKKYNYKFTQLKAKKDFLEGEPNIYNVVFVKK